MPACSPVGCVAADVPAAPTGGQSQFPGDGRNRQVLTEVRGPSLPKRRAYYFLSCGSRSNKRASGFRCRHVRTPAASGCARCQHAGTRSLEAVDPVANAHAGSPMQKGPGAPRRLGLGLACRVCIRRELGEAGQRQRVLFSDAGPVEIEAEGARRAREDGHSSAASLPVHAATTRRRPLVGSGSFRLLLGGAV